MGWKVLERYTKECGCVCEDHENDVDRPFMCYTDYSTTEITRCDTHERQHQEYCAKTQAELEHRQQLRQEKRQQLKTHLLNLAGIEHQTLAPIKEAVSKYRECNKIGNSDRWIQRDITHRIGSLLMVSKIRNKWMCSKERLEYSNFNLIFDFQSFEINELLNEQS